MLENVVIRQFEPRDAAVVDQVARAAWQQYSQIFSDWTRTAGSICNLASMAHEMELIVAEHEDCVRGVVCYVAPGKKRMAAFPGDWALIRMLSVDPCARGLGIGRRLAEACVDCAKRDGVTTIGLHTSPAMAIALGMYQRMGFQKYRDLPDTHGVAYAIYCRAVTWEPV